MARERVNLPKLEECKKCGYVACICPILRQHGQKCTRRVAVLDTSPKPCGPHGVIACETCWPCNCRRKE